MIISEHRARLEYCWNTGRPYTVNGQRIAVWTVDMEDSRFFLMRDFDRDITHMFRHEDFETEAELRRYVMWCYDYGEHKVGGVGYWRAATQVLSDFPLRTLRFRPAAL